MMLKPSARAAASMTNPEWLLWSSVHANLWLLGVIPHMLQC